MRRTTHSTLSLLVFVAACAGTSPNVAPPSSAAPPHATAPRVESPAASALDEPSSAAEHSDDVDDDRVREAVGSLRDRLGVPAEEIEVVAFEEGRWTNGSIGCPQPGRKYTARIVEGYRVVLAHDGQEFHFHGTGDAAPRLCEAPRDGALLPPKDRS